jgi:hypothetical protein
VRLRKKGKGDREGRRGVTGETFVCGYLGGLPEGEREFIRG